MFVVVYIPLSSRPITASSSVGVIPARLHRVFCHRVSACRCVADVMRGDVRTSEARSVWRREGFVEVRTEAKATRRTVHAAPLRDNPALV